MWQPTEIESGTGFCWNTFEIKAPGETSVEEILEPETWAHVFNRVKPGDTIVVKSEANLFVAILHVGKVIVGGVTVVPILVTDLSVGVKDLPKGSKFEVEWGGPTHKYRVLRGKDVVEAGFANKADAIEYAGKLGS